MGGVHKCISKGVNWLIWARPTCWHHHDLTFHFLSWNLTFWSAERQRTRLKCIQTSKMSIFNLNNACSAKINHCAEADLKIANMDAVEKLHLLQLHTKYERFLNENQLIFYAILQNRHQSTICYRKICDIVSFIQQFTVIFKWRFCRCQVEWRSALFRSEISCQIWKSNTEIHQNGYVTERNTYAFVFFCY